MNLAKIFTVQGNDTLMFLGAVAAYGGGVCELVFTCSLRCTMMEVRPRQLINSNEASIAKRISATFFYFIYHGSISDNFQRHDQNDVASQVVNS